MADGFRTVYYRRADGKWDYRVVARNGKTVLNSDQGYENRGDAEDIANKVLDPMIARNFSLDVTAYPPANEGTEI